MKCHPGFGRDGVAVLFMLTVGCGSQPEYVDLNDPFAKKIEEAVCDFEHEECGDRFDVCQWEAIAANEDCLASCTLDVDAGRECLRFLRRFNCRGPDQQFLPHIIACYGALSCPGEAQETCLAGVTPIVPDE